MSYLIQNPEIPMAYASSSMKVFPKLQKLIQQLSPNENGHISLHFYNERDVELF